MEETPKEISLARRRGLSGASVMAQMPVPLLDNKAVADPALRSLFPKNESSQWELAPPQGFAVFGLPVQSITIYIDPEGEFGASYTASVAASQAMTAKAAKLKNDGRKPRPAA
jgi:hypothetical protein